LSYRNRSQPVFFWMKQNSKTGSIVSPRNPVNETCFHIVTKPGFTPGNTPSQRLATSIPADTENMAKMQNLSRIS